MKRVLSATLIIVLAFSTSTGFATTQAEEDEQRAVVPAPSFEQEILELQRLFTEVETFISSLFVRAELSQETIDALSREITKNRIILQTFEGILHGYTIAIQENQTQIMINRDRLEGITRSLEDHETRLAALERVEIPVDVDLHQQMERLNLIAVIALIASVGAIVLLAGGG
ncbi:TPA: hypothetical protein DD712_02070 [Candidatus Acetothermia bacterium]|nr:hypothetical protein [Candidatus Acetothermia bacterium]